MTVLTGQEAIDEIFARFNVAWLTVSPSILAYVPTVYWQGKEEPAKPDYLKYFARVSQQTVLETQRTLSTECGLPGQKRFGIDGLLFIQIFCPKTDAKAWGIGRQLATIARNAYRGNRAGDTIVYRRPRIKELDSELECLRYNVIAEYEYDELG